MTGLLLKMNFTRQGISYGGTKRIQNKSIPRPLAHPGKCHR